MDWVLIMCHYVDSKTLIKECNDESKMQLVKLDVTSQEDVVHVKQVVDETLNRTGLELTALVNNAGVGCLNKIEWHDSDKVHLIWCSCGLTVVH